MAGIDFVLITKSDQLIIKTILSRISSFFLSKYLLFLKFVSVLEYRLGDTDLRILLKVMMMSILLENNLLTVNYEIQAKVKVRTKVTR